MLIVYELLVFHRSLILVVLIVFGCIVISFVLSGLKTRLDFRNWTSIAGSAFKNLATTVNGKNGIILPKVHYQHGKRGEKDGQQHHHQQQQHRRCSQCEDNSLPTISGAVKYSQTLDYAKQANVKSHEYDDGVINFAYSGPRLIWPPQASRK